MTDIEFATCDLEHLGELNVKTNYKKFYQLQYDDEIFAVYVSIDRYTQIYHKFKFQLKGLEITTQQPNKYINNKTRLCNIYFDNLQDCIRQHKMPRGIQTDKNKSSVIKYKKINKKTKTIIIYATTLQECINRTENILQINIENKLQWNNNN